MATPLILFSGFNFNNVGGVNTVVIPSRCALLAVVCEGVFDTTTDAATYQLGIGFQDSQWSATTAPAPVNGAIVVYRGGLHILGASGSWLIDLRRYTQLPGIPLAAGQRLYPQGICSTGSVVGFFQLHLLQG